MAECVQCRTTLEGCHASHLQGSSDEAETNNGRMNDRQLEQDKAFPYLVLHAPLHTQHTMHV